MKQIEVRLAVVLYGGVSLAVYIHGVTREILNLVRASKLFHANGEAKRPQDDSVAVYFDLFKELSETIELRVVVDLISGASAGGINGVMLAKALAHDLPLEPHRDLWLQNADVVQLSAPGNVVTRLGKVAMAPMFDLFLTRQFGQQVADTETREKLRHFVQLRWFAPPFSGERFAGWMLDACDAMEKDAKPEASLLPPGHRLDLFVTLTDYRGHRHKILLHDPPSVEETEHRRIVSFQCFRSLSGKIKSEFTTGDVPSLVFSARATASFPGAFKPAAVTEMDAILAARGRTWPSRSRFVQEKLGLGNPGETTEAESYFIDGSVVMNKPFSPVIHALGNRPASREVVRRIIYVDPNPYLDAAQKSGQGAPGGAPGGTPGGASGGAPGFFRTILASLAHIPRNEPIGDDLTSIQEWNGKAKRMAEILAAADPQVERLVDEIVSHDSGSAPTIAEVAAYRSAGNEKAHIGAGYAYLSYQTLKIRRVIERLSRLVSGLAKSGGLTVEAGDVGKLLDRWAEQDGQREKNRIVPFLRAFDADFRLRRIRFVIRRLNELYRTISTGGKQAESAAIDDLKTALYEIAERVQQVWSLRSYDTEIMAAAMRIAGAATAGQDLSEADLARFDAAMGLTAFDRQIDEVVSLMGFAYLPAPARRAVTMAYVGFAFYDLITYPILQWTEMDEINEILVDRISPVDSHGLNSGLRELKGASLMSFGAFFNRAWREHDYLWGRLNAADRFVDVLASAIGPRAPELFDAERLRAKLFRAILDSEAPHLKADTSLIPNLQRSVARRYGKD